MGLKNSHDNAVRDVKASLFDLFCEHTEELVGLIEILAKNDEIDAVQIESLIFQRIVMLNKMAGSAKSLVLGVGNLSSAKNAALKSGLTVVNSAKQVVEDKAPVKTAAPVQQSVPNVSSVEKTPVQAVSVQPTVAPIVPAARANPQSTTPVSNPVQVTSAPAPVTSVPVTTTPVPSVQPTTAAPVIENNVAVEQKAVVMPKEKVRFVKSADKKVKAIMVTDKQFTKLKSSYPVQFRLVDLASMPSNLASKEKIEDLMRKASTLYKEGKVSEAQALYAEISNLNKQLKKSDAKVLTLNKVA